MKKIIILFLLITSCTSQNIDQRIDYIKELNNTEFKKFIHQNSFAIYSLQKINNNQEVVVYIEGDGLSWIDRFTPSSDPTPTDPLAFKLALIDNSENIIYLARPCQYEWSNNCNKDVWTVAQYSSTVLNSYKEIINQGIKLDTSINLFPIDFAKTNKLVETMGMLELNKYIKQEEIKGKEQIVNHKIEKHKRIAFPFSSIILTIIAVAIGSKKIKGGIGLNLGIGIILSFSYILFMQVSTTFAINGNLSPLVAVWIPNIIFMAIGMYQLKIAPK